MGVGAEDAAVGAGDAAVAVMERAGNTASTGRARSVSTSQEKNASSSRVRIVRLERIARLAVREMRLAGAETVVVLVAAGAVVVAAEQAATRSSNWNKRPSQPWDRSEGL